MSHNSSISRMGEPVQATRVINEKQLLLIMVGINAILSCGKEYVKLVSEIKPCCLSSSLNRIVSFININSVSFKTRDKNLSATMRAF
jgi:hypothetical protein